MQQLKIPQQLLPKYEQTSTIKCEFVKLILFMEAWKTVAWIIVDVKGIEDLNI